MLRLTLHPCSQFLINPQISFQLSESQSEMVSMAIRELLDIWIYIKLWNNLNYLIINTVNCVWLELCALGTILTVEECLFCSETALWIRSPFIRPSRHWVGKTSGASRILASTCLCVWRCAITQLWGYLCLTVTVKTEDATIFCITVWCFFYSTKTA